MKRAAFVTLLMGAACVPEVPLDINGSFAEDLECEIVCGDDAAVVEREELRFSMSGTEENVSRVDEGGRTWLGTASGVFLSLQTQDQTFLGELTMVAIEVDEETGRALRFSVEKQSTDGSVVGGCSSACTGDAQFR